MVLDGGLEGRLCRRWHDDHCDGFGRGPFGELDGELHLRLEERGWLRRGMRHGWHGDDWRDNARSGCGRFGELDGPVERGLLRHALSDDARRLDRGEHGVRLDGLGLGLFAHRESFESVFQAGIGLEGHCRLPMLSLRCDASDWCRGAN